MRPSELFRLYDVFDTTYVDAEAAKAKREQDALYLPRLAGYRNLLKLAREECNGLWIERTLGELARTAGNYRALVLPHFATVLEDDLFSKGYITTSERISGLREPFLKSVADRLLLEPDFEQLVEETRIGAYRFLGHRLKRVGRATQIEAILG